MSKDNPRIVNTSTRERRLITNTELPLPHPSTCTSDFTSIHGAIISTADDKLSSCQLRCPCECSVACEKQISPWLSEFFGFVYLRTLGVLLLINRHNKKGENHSVPMESDNNENCYRRGFPPVGSPTGQSMSFSALPQRHVNGRIIKSLGVEPNAPCQDEEAFGLCEAA